MHGVVVVPWFVGEGGGEGGGVLFKIGGSLILDVDGQGVGGLNLELVCKQENNENVVDINIFPLIWFIDSESLCFILILKEKMRRT